MPDFLPTDLESPATLKTAKKLQKTKAIQFVKYLDFYGAALLAPCAGLGLPWLVRSDLMVEAVRAYFEHYAVRQWGWPRKVTETVSPNSARIAQDSVNEVRRITEQTNEGHLVTNETMDSDMAVAIRWMDGY